MNFQRFKKTTLITVLQFFSLALFAQDIPIGTWRDHLPYSDAISVSYGDEKVYCATNSAVFIYALSDQSIERLNLVKDRKSTRLNSCLVKTSYADFSL